MVSGRASVSEPTFVSFLWGGTRTVNERSLTVNRKSLSMSDSIVLDEATRTPSAPDTTTRSTPWSSVFSMSIKSPTVLVTGRNVNWQSSRLDGRGTVTAGSPRRSSTRISANKMRPDVMDPSSMCLGGFFFHFPSHKNTSAPYWTRVKRGQNCKNYTFWRHKKNSCYRSPTSCR